MTDFFCHQYLSHTTPDSSVAPTSKYKSLCHSEPVFFSFCVKQICPQDINEHEQCLHQYKYPFQIVASLSFNCGNRLSPVCLQKRNLLCNPPSLSLSEWFLTRTRVLQISYPEETTQVSKCVRDELKIMSC